MVLGSNRIEITGIDGLKVYMNFKPLWCRSSVCKADEEGGGVG